MSNHVPSPSFRLIYRQQLTCTCNILKIFQADNYVADVKWNENKNLFVFENCVYDLEKDKHKLININNKICIDTAKSRLNFITIV